MALPDATAWSVPDGFVALAARANAAGTLIVSQAGVTGNVTMNFLKGETRDLSDLVTGGPATFTATGVEVYLAENS